MAVFCLLFHYLITVNDEMIQLLDVISLTDCYLILEIYFLLS